MAAPVYVAGVDASGKSYDVHIRAEALGAKGHHLKVANSPAGTARLAKRLARLDGCVRVIAVEASGGVERRLHEDLTEAGFPVAIVDPRRVKCHAGADNVRAKTDAIDARTIADFAATRLLRATPLRSSKHRQGLELLKYRQSLVDAVAADRNRLRQFHGPIVRQFAADRIAAAQQEIKAIETAVLAIVQADEELHRLFRIVTSAPGIGRLTGLILVMALPELGTLNAKQIAALVGLAPYNDESGNRDGHRHIWGGRKIVRCALYFPALTAIRTIPTLGNHYKRLIDKGKPAKVAITACMRRLLVILNAMVKNNTPYQAQNAP